MAKKANENQVNSGNTVANFAKMRLSHFGMYSFQKTPQRTYPSAHQVNLVVFNSKNATESQKTFLPKVENTITSEMVNEITTMHKTLLSKGEINPLEKLTKEFNEIIEKLYEFNPELKNKKFGDTTGITYGIQYQEAIKEFIMAVMQTSSAVGIEISWSTEKMVITGILLKSGQKENTYSEPKQNEDGWKEWSESENEILTNIVVNGTKVSGKIIFSANEKFMAHQLTILEAKYQQAKANENVAKAAKLQ